MTTQANVALGITAQNATNNAFRAARQNVNSLRRDVDGMAGATLRNRRLIQQFGMQVSDFSVQVAGGQSAILALTQQVPQFVQGFGAVGGILAMLITIFGTLALVITKTGMALNDLTPIAGVLRSEVEWLAMAFDFVKETAIDMANVIVNNLDRIAITAGVTIGYFAAGWVASMLAATGATFTLMGALTALRALLLRFLPVAIILAVGELVYQFLRLREAAGGVGAAFGMLWDVVSEVIGRIGMGFEALQQVFIAAANKLESVFLMALNRVVGGFMESTWAIADGLNVLFNTNMFRGAMLGEVTQALGQSAAAADAAATAAMNMSTTLTEGMMAPLQSVQAIRDALAGLPADAEIDIRDWFGGVEEGAGGAGGAAEKAAKQVETFGQAIAGVISSGLDRLFDDLFEGGKNAISILRDIGKELLKLVAKQQFFTALSKFMPGTFGAGGFIDLTKMIKPYAKGGVVNSPTLFPMSGGRTGMAGEAGPEAILPLTRGSNGALGVQAQGGGGGAGLVVNVVTPPGSTVEQSERTGPGGVTIRDIVIKEMQQATASGQMDRVNRQRYNMAPVPVKR